MKKLLFIVLLVTPIIYQASDDSNDNAARDTLFNPRVSDSSNHDKYGRFQLVVFGAQNIHRTRPTWQEKAMQDFQESVTPDWFKGLIPTLSPIAQEVKYNFPVGIDKDEKAKMISALYEWDQLGQLGLLDQSMGGKYDISTPLNAAVAFHIWYEKRNQDQKSNMEKK